MNRHNRRTSRRLYVREQLTGYGSEALQDIPYWDRYMRYLTLERGCTTQHVQLVGYLLKKFVAFLDNEYNMDTFDPYKIEPFHIRRYLSYLKNDLDNKPSTRNHKIDAIRSYYSFLDCFELIEENEIPTLYIRRARVSRQLPIHLNFEEVEALLTVAEKSKTPERDVAILRVLIQTGIRTGELLRLRLKDINFSESTLFVMGKGYRERLVPLTDNTCEALKSYLAVRKAAMSYIDALFLNRINTPLRQGTLYVLFKKLCSEAGVQKHRLSVCHLRHTCLTLLLEEGADLMALKRLAGHKSVRTTQIYLSVSQKQLREAMKKHPLG